MVLIIPLENLNALAWTLFSISAVLTFGRFYLRWKKAYRFYWDDIFNALALGSLLIFLITYQIFLPIDYNAELYELGVGGHVTTNDQWLYASDVNFANASFFWITLYCVKGSFLALYWELFSVSSGFKKAWADILGDVRVIILDMWESQRHS
ncbi:hypothetical protein CJF30_00009963 [Rutstroemia sp. NJR-2017a BBW]|nr:hypothetical protein CJF30_00009963 [Rutstroemia sp. NJR-2017a BBW]